MTFGAQIRLAGAVVVIIGALTNVIVLSLVGLYIMCVGAVWQIDSLEKRVAALESKENQDEQA